MLSIVDNLVVLVSECKLRVVGTCTYAGMRFSVPKVSKGRLVLRHMFRLCCLSIQFCVTMVRSVSIGNTECETVKIRVLVIVSVGQATVQLTWYLW